MIVTCPACSSRYKFDDARLDGRSAKITCPSCDHVFVVHPPRVDPVTLTDTWASRSDSSAADPSHADSAKTNPSIADSLNADSSNAGLLKIDSKDRQVDIQTYDFSAHGVTLRVRQGLVNQDFHTLADIEDALDDGSIELSDELSADGAVWLPIASRQALRARLLAVVDRIEQGEEITQKPFSNLVIGDEDGDEDAPTMIVRSSSLNLSDDLDDDLDEPPPAAAGGFDGPGDDPVTETVEAATSKTQPTAGTPVRAPVGTAPAQPESSRPWLPLTLLVLVVLAVLALILYSQGLFAGQMG